MTRIIGNVEDRNANVRENNLNEMFMFDQLPTNKIHVFSVLLNNLICLYHATGHKQLIEVRKKMIPIFYLYLYRII